MSIPISWAIFIGLFFFIVSGTDGGWAAMGFAYLVGPILIGVSVATFIVYLVKSIIKERR